MNSTSVLATAIAISSCTCAITLCIAMRQMIQMMLLRIVFTFQCLKKRKKRSNIVHNWTLSICYGHLTIRARAFGAERKSSLLKSSSKWNERGREKQRIHADRFPVLAVQLFFDSPNRMWRVSIICMYVCARARVCVFDTVRVRSNVANIALDGAFENVAISLDK